MALLDTLSSIAEINNAANAQRRSNAESDAKMNLMNQQALEVEANTADIKKQTANRDVEANKVRTATALLQAESINNDLTVLRTRYLNNEITLAQRDALAMPYVSRLAELNKDYPFIGVPDLNQPYVVADFSKPEVRESAIKAVLPFITQMDLTKDTSYGNTTEEKLTNIFTTTYHYSPDVARELAREAISGYGAEQRSKLMVDITEAQKNALVTAFKNPAEKKAYASAVVQALAEKYPILDQDKDLRNNAYKVIAMGENPDIVRTKLDNINRIQTQEMADTEAMKRLLVNEQGANYRAQLSEGGANYRARLGAASGGGGSSAAKTYTTKQLQDMEDKNLKYIVDGNTKIRTGLKNSDTGVVNDGLSLIKRSVNGNLELQNFTGNTKDKIGKLSVGEISQLGVNAALAGFETAVKNQKGTMHYTGMGPFIADAFRRYDNEVIVPATMGMDKATAAKTAVYYTYAFSKALSVATNGGYTIKGANNLTVSDSDSALSAYSKIVSSKQKKTIKQTKNTPVRSSFIGAKGF